MRCVKAAFHDTDTDILATILARMLARMAVLWNVNVNVNQLFLVWLK